MSLSGPGLLAQAASLQAHPLLLVALGSLGIFLLAAVLIVFRLTAKLREQKTTQATLRQELEETRVANAQQREQIATAHATSKSLLEHADELQNALAQLPDSRQLQSQLQRVQLANHVLRRCQVRLESQAQKFLQQLRKRDSRLHHQRQAAKLDQHIQRRLQEALQIQIHEQNSELHDAETHMHRIAASLDYLAETAKHHRSKNVGLRYQLKRANRKVRSLRVAAMAELASRQTDRRSLAKLTSCVQQQKTRGRNSKQPPSQFKLQMAERKLKSLRRLLSR